MTDHNRDDLHGIPRWNGDPPRFKRWQQEVKIYKLRKDLSKEVSYAADFIVGLTGPARVAALQLSEEELWPLQALRDEAEEEAQLAQPDENGQQPRARNVAMKETNMLAIDTLVKRLERDLLQSKPVQRGERVESFFGSQKYVRKRGMKMTESNCVLATGL